MSLSKSFFRWLRRNLHDVGFENDLPSEFIITNHAKQRLNKRLAYPHKHQIIDLMLDAWHIGLEPPESFNRDKGHKPKKHFKGFVYKWHEGYIWIWGIKEHSAFDDGQKFLITIYNWKR